MKIVKYLTILSLLALPFMGYAMQDEQTDGLQTVTIEAKGQDVQSVLSDLFIQAKKNYVIEPKTNFSLHLALYDFEFEEALNIICKTSKLEYKIQNGIYYVSKIKSPAKPAEEPMTVAPKEEPKQKPVTPKHLKSKTFTKPKGKLSQSVLNKRITTRLPKVNIRLLFASLSQQTGVPIDVSENVPDYKLDAYLLDTSLKYALDQITGAAKLKYEFTDNMSIAIFKPGAESKANAKPKPTNRVSMIN